MPQIDKRIAVGGGIAAIIFLCGSCAVFAMVGAVIRNRPASAPIRSVVTPVQFATAEPTDAPPTSSPIPPTVAPTDTPAPPTEGPTVIPVPPTAEPTATPVAIVPTEVPGFQIAQVVRVVDGDTIEVNLDGQQYTVRYILVDTPETKKPNTPVQPFGPEATEANRQLVEGQTVRLEKDVSEIDQYGRLLRYVYVGDLMVNEELLRLGLAKVATFPPDVKYVDRFLAVQRQAQLAGVGMWRGEPVAVEPTPTQVQVESPSVGSCPQGCNAPSAGCQIKGNISSKGEKIYHEPGFRDYDKTKISPAKGERWFCTSAEAVANGWRAALQ